MTVSDNTLCAWYFLPSRLGAAFLCGVLFFLALPPCNWSWLVIFPLAGLLLCLRYLKWYECLLAGFLFGLGWAFPGFWFLREIHPAVPFGIAPVLALWPAVWAVSAVFFLKYLLYPVKVRLDGEAAMEDFLPGAGRRILTAAVLAALWIVLEFSRSTMLPWNNLATAVWRYPRLLAPASVTGVTGIGFLIANLSCALALAWVFRKKDKKQYPLWFGAVLPAVLLPSLVSVYRAQNPVPEKMEKYRIAAVQGDISQRRNADHDQAFEALKTYLDMTREAVKIKPAPDVIVWPETAVPYAFRGNHPVSALYRSELQKIILSSGIPVLFGTIEFRESPPFSGNYRITNSALYLTPGGIAARYDKIHRVPFGEYIPFRNILPGALVRAIDMNRDLLAGTDFSPVTLKPGIRAGVAICFESVFPYVARESVRRGANMLLVISNDAWYPTSSEPEQHLANAVARSVENGRYSVRCGNNGGTLLISPDGVISQILTVPGTGAPELRRGRGIGVIEVPVPAEPAMTFYTRYGEWFTALCGCLVLAGFAVAGSGFLAFRRALLGRMEENVNAQ
ncbi:MAG: apolipoprotein N-acyltransferase [Lentisphaeria bacterium]|nr:apolipoprotein N-acyltransferase [Lentisphaeria bacterium]